MAAPDRPYFLWDVDVSESQLREWLRQPDPDARAQWQACILREARFVDVWHYLSLQDILSNWEPIRRHLGRQRAFWEFLLDGWREDGLLPGPDFRRMLAARGAERCVVDLVIDRAPVLDALKPVFGHIRVDTLREITANKVCALLGRAEIKDLVDLQALLSAGGDLEQALADGEAKDAGLDPATLAWVLDQLTIGPTTRLPTDIDLAELVRFRLELVRRLRQAAFARTV